MWVLEGKRKDIWEEIEKHPHEKEVRVKTKPGKEMFLRILDMTEVNKIYITRGLYKTISKKVVDALESAGVRIIVLERKAGRPPKFEEEVKEKAKKMIGEGRKAKYIAGKLKVPSTSVYLWKRKMGKEKDFLARVPDST
ncbi:MAG: hypothetical protein ABIH83_02525 [Candidatus Micrarchaeota archaeon]